MTIEKIKNDPKRGMYCIDWNEDIKVYGNEKDDLHQRLEIMMLPCNVVPTQSSEYRGIATAEADDECVADLDAQVNYLGPLDFMLYYTEEVFKQ